MSESEDPAAEPVIVGAKRRGSYAMVRRIRSSISLHVVEEPGGAVAGILLTDDQAVRLTQALWGAHVPTKPE